MKHLNTNEEKGLSLDMGNSEVFTRMYKQFYAPLCYYSFRMVGDRENAEDIIDELFGKLFQKSQGFEDESHLKFYLYSSAHRASLNYIRSESNLKFREGKFAQGYEETEQSVQHNLIRTEIYNDIYKAIMSLPSQCGKVIRLSYLEGMENARIAQEMGLSIQTVKNHKHHGLKLLKGKLSSEIFLLLVWCPTLLLPIFHKN